MRNLTLPGSGEASAKREPAAFAHLPSIDRLLGEPALAPLVERLGPQLVKRAAQEEVALLRERVRTQGPAADSAAPAGRDLLRAIEERAHGLAASRLPAVFNLTGTVIHTNLGRALLAEEAIEAVAAAMRGCVALEYDLASGGRGDRDVVVEDLLRELTGAEAATVVNNCAAAVLLTLKALGARREVLISRGELIEIGGAFRMPDIMRAAGCKLVEVGTTNRTHPRDFADAIGPRTALVLKAHTSNYAVTGFTAAVDEHELAGIAHARQVPFAVDLGSGALVDLGEYGLPKEPLPREVLAAGADVVMFSGDKLLGGPQAGMIVGRRDLIARIRKDPLKRALRVSKLTLAALEATLRIYASAFRLPERLPTLALLVRGAGDIRAACERLLPAFAQFAGADFTARVEDCASQIGSGAQPVERLPSCAIVLAPHAARGAGRKLNALGQRLRALALPVIGRVQDNALWLDLRCLRDEMTLQAQLLGHEPEEGS
ncbi:MAG TPA: L-seryl-tRNA(Sec) selenium transferase [Burkholderiaceae bacterium]|nr:L-seryl-tRNA(Sec) selenium transferase [Burkholderiaceae bacterium]